jgi:hypothetical protein
MAKIKTVETDVTVTGGGSVFLFILHTKAAKRWVDRNVSSERTYLGNGLAVEHRYAQDLAAGMTGDGLVLR